MLAQLILEEFGKWVKPDSAATQAERDAFYTLVYQAVQTVCLCSLCHPTPAPSPAPSPLSASPWHLPLLAVLPPNPHPRSPSCAESLPLMHAPTRTSNTHVWLTYVLCPSMIVCMVGALACACVCVCVCVCILACLHDVGFAGPLEHMSSMMWACADACACVHAVGNNSKTHGMRK